jgi:hypothetical protein
LAIQLGIKVDSHDYQKIKYQIITYNQSYISNIKYPPQTANSLPVLSQKPDSFLKLLKYPEPAVH